MQAGEVKRKNPAKFPVERNWPDFSVYIGFFRFSLPGRFGAYSFCRLFHFPSSGSPAGQHQPGGGYGKAYFICADLSAPCFPDFHG